MAAHYFAQIEFDLDQAMENDSTFEGSILNDPKWLVQ